MYTISVIQGDVARFRLSWRPQVCASHIFLILCCGDHCIVHSLELLRVSRRLAADVISRVPWEGLSLEAELVSLERRSVIESQSVGMLRATEGHLSIRDLDIIIILRQIQSISANINIGGWVFPNEVCIIADWVNTCALDSWILEATIRSDRFRLCSCC